MRWGWCQPDAICPSLSHFASLPSMHVQTFLQMKCGGLFCFFKLCGNIKYIIILQGSYKSKFMILKQCIFVERVLPEEKNLSILCIQRHQTKMLELSCSCSYNISECYSRKTGFADLKQAESCNLLKSSNLSAPRTLSDNFKKMFNCY